jgi:hypothetical protein
VVKTNRAQANSESELTFKPKIISLPTSIYGNAGTPRNNGNYGHHSTANPNTTPTFTAGMYNLSFEERAIRASRDKAVKIAMSKEINEKALLKECTHVPKINKNSERAAMMKKKDSRSVAERLYDERIVLERRQKLRMEEKALEDKRKLMEEHTFQPQLKTRGKDGKGSMSGLETPVAIESRYRRVAASPCQRPTSEKDEECTFTPNVKGIHKSMSSAKVYLKTDVFQRLQKGEEKVKENVNPVYYAGEQPPPPPQSTDAGGEQVMDMATFMSNVQAQGVTPATTTATKGGAKPAPRPSSARRARPSPSYPNNANNNRTPNSKPANSRPSSASRSRPPSAADTAAFHEFLARQNHTELKKQQKLKHLGEQNKNSFTPQLCAGTKEYVATSNRQSKDFLRYVEADLKRRSDAQTERDKWTDPEMKAGPELSKKTRMLAEGGRTVLELSSGDMRKKEFNLALLKVKVDMEEEKKQRSVPLINKKMAGSEMGSNVDMSDVEGKLRIKSDPGSYLERLQKEAKKKKDRERRRQQELLLKDGSECTFKPQTSECPGYIKRIARSMALTKTSQAAAAAAAGGGGMVDEKPEWR